MNVKRQLPICHACGQRIGIQAAGGRATAANMTKAERSAAGLRAAKARWDKARKAAK